MEKQVIPLAGDSNISFTKRSNNIQIGDYVVIQRKGSKRESKGIPIDSLKHKANDVQIKMHIKKFFNEVGPIAWYQL